MISTELNKQRDNYLDEYRPRKRLEKAPFRDKRQRPIEPTCFEPEGSPQNFTLWKWKN